MFFLVHSFCFFFVFFFRVSFFIVSNAVVGNVIFTSVPFFLHFLKRENNSAE